MELRHLRYFCAIVDAGSLTAASTALRIAQPSLSVAMTKLEAEVGVPLLIRTARGVEPTSAGRFLLDASSRVLGEIDDIVAALGRFGSGVVGSLTVAAVPVLMWHRMPELVRAHVAEVPDLEIQLVDPPPWTAIDMLQQRKVDLAAIVVSDPRRFAERHRGTLDVVDWGEIPMVAVLPPDHRDAPEPLPITAFDGQLVLMPRRTAAVASLPEAVDALFLRHGITPASVRTVDTIQAGLPLIQAGIGRAILPDPDHASLDRFDVTVRQLVPPPKALRALMLSRVNGSADPKVAGLLARVRAAAQ